MRERLVKESTKERKGALESWNGWVLKEFTLQGAERKMVWRWPW